MKLGREECKALVPGPIQWGARVLQAGMGRCPWRVAVASMLLCRTRRVQAEPVLRVLLDRWPTAADLAHADTAAIEGVVRTCGFGRQRARQLQRFSVEWLGDWWEDMRELTGVGVYVADAVSIACFDCTEMQSTDHALRVLCDELSTSS